MNVQMTLPDYVVSPNEDLWEVANNGEAFVWTDSNRTAAMSVQLEAVCGPVLRNRGGLPSLTAILFLVDALTTPISSQTASTRIEILLRPVRSKILDDAKVRLVTWLVACGQINADLRKGPVRQGAMLNNLMEDAPAALFEVQALQAIDAMQWLRLSLPDRGLTYYRPQVVSAVKSALAVQTLLHFANSPLNEASVRLRMQTGLNELPVGEFEAVLPPAVKYSRLLNDLRDDDELGQFIQMASNAASTLALPRKPSDPDELQVGGVSDITNRGQPERLLATELAADPDLLMARIAYGQALYLRRESPPLHKPLSRRVLIENGIRMWGVTRLRATAFALAVAACEERSHGPKVEVITVAGRQTWSDDLSTRDGLVAQLERLEPDAHPGKALLQLAKTWDSDAEEFAEPLLIVSRNTHLDPDFRKCLTDFPRPFLVARIDKEGLVELLHCTRLGDDVIHTQRMVLPLNKLVAAGRPANDLPMLLRQLPCPLRFSADLSVRWAYLNSGPTLWTMTHNRRLMCFDTAGVGAIEVGSLPGEILACSTTSIITLVVAQPIPNTQRMRHLVVRANSCGTLSVVNLESTQGDAPNVRFEFDELYLRRGTLLRIGTHLTVFIISSGKALAEVPLLNRRHLGGRFFCSENVIWAAVYTNDSIQWHKLGATDFEPIFATQGANGFPLIYSKDFTHVQVFDGEGDISRVTGAFIDCDFTPKTLLRNPTDLSVIVEVERVKKLLTMESSIAHNDHSTHWLKLDQLKISRITNSYSTALYNLDNQTSKLATTQSVRNRLQGIAIIDGRIVLFRNISICFAIDFSFNPRRVFLRGFKPMSQYSIVNFEREFKVENSPFQHQWTLKKAVLPQGEAWLDSRGLLHLRARDGSELSLVLHDNHVSGWHSDGSVFGTQYFINRPETPVPPSVEAWLKEFANQCSN